MNTAEQPSHAAGLADHAWLLDEFVGFSVETRPVWKFTQMGGWNSHSRIDVIDDGECERRWSYQQF